MNLTPHFTLAEMMATKVQHDNTCPPELIPELTKTAQMLEKIRAYLCFIAKEQIPIKVTSGYRCLAVNAAIGSKPTSDHIRAMAADIQAPSFGTSYDVSKALSENMPELGIGQVIYEFGSWAHVSRRAPDKAINRIITINKTGTHVGIQKE